MVCKIFFVPNFPIFRKGRAEEEENANSKALGFTSKRNKTFLINFKGKYLRGMKLDVRNELTLFPVFIEYYLFSCTLRCLINGGAQNKRGGGGGWRFLINLIDGGVKINGGGSEFQKIR